MRIRNPLHALTVSGVALAGLIGVAPLRAEGPPAHAHPDTGRAATPFDKTLTLQGVTFRVHSANDRSINRLRISASGTTQAHRPIVREIDGTVSGAEVADLNGDGSPEIYVYVTSAGSGSYGSLVAYAANRRKSLSEIHLPPVQDNPKVSPGYMGHDEFVIVENTLVQRFPLYGSGDSNARPTGPSRQVQYRLQAGEAGWILRLDRVVDLQ